MSDLKKRLISHRELKKYMLPDYPMAFIDKIVDYGDDFIHAIKNVTSNEPQLQGHFPEYAIFPGTLILEAMSQVAGILLTVKRLGIDLTIPMEENERLKDFDKISYDYLVGVEKCRFRSLVVPGDTMHIHAECNGKIRLHMMRFDCKVFVNDKLTSKANVMIYSESGKK